jgi:hypothetical protein
MSEDRMLVLTAKITMLERLVRLLLLDRVKQNDKPLETATQLSAHIIATTEAQMAGGPHSHAAMLAVENLRLFFDQLIHEVSQEPPPS